MEINKSNIVALRNLQGWSQEDLAAAAELSVRTVQRMETDGQGSQDSAKAIASAFDVKLEKIFEPVVPIGYLIKVIFKTLWPYLLMTVLIGAVVFYLLYNNKITEPGAAFFAGAMGSTFVIFWVAEIYWSLFKRYGPYNESNLPHIMSWKTNLKLGNSKALRF